MTEQEKKYFTELSKKYPTRRAAACEIIRLNAILNLPKGTEHFMSDLHGEWEAFSHIRKNASGVVCNKIALLFDGELSDSEQKELASLIYYPEEKLVELRGTDASQFYEKTVERLLAICRLATGKYTRDVAREHLSRCAEGFEYIIDELLWDSEDDIKKEYRKSIIKTAIRVGIAEELIVALCSSIKSLLIDRLHIVGDIFDRGPRPDLIIDELMREKSIDIQWGNHDVLWMGAAAGSEVCIATVLNNSMTYKNLDIIEIGYGISLRPLEEFAEKIYGKSDISAFLPKGNSGGNEIGGGNDELVARMHKAISIIQFKLEVETILRNPSFNMNSRLILSTLDKKNKTVTIDGVKYELSDVDFPTIKNAPYKLTDSERELMKYLVTAFARSEKLQRHIRFIYERGEMYTVYNGNLLFHGSIPMTNDGEFLSLDVAGGLHGKSLMDFCDRMARQGYFSKEESDERRFGRDFLWFLWCGKNSPLAGREKITSFERLLIKDKSAWVEPKNSYDKVWNDTALAEKILKEFGLPEKVSHIVNGHIPVNKGENPIKADGRVLVIDGGFCKAYHNTTGIGGYTLIYNSDGMRLTAHKPFIDKKSAISNGESIISEIPVFEHKPGKMRIRECDLGESMREIIADLVLLMREYESGNIKESGLPYSR